MTPMKRNKINGSKLATLSAAAALACGLLCSTTSSLAQATQPDDVAPATASASQPVLHPSARASERIDVNVGESRTIDAPWQVKRVSVAKPDIADVDATSPTRIVIEGKSVGVTELVLEGEQGQIWRSKLEISADTSRLEGQLRKLFANSSLEVAQMDDVVVVKGTLAKAEDSTQLRQLLTLSKLQYLDLTGVAGLQQVQLQVKVAEVSRTAIRSLSSDWAFGDLTTTFAVNNAASGTFNPATPIGNLTRTLPGGTTIFGTGTIGGTTFEYFLKAMTENQYLRILAEPTLVARSGQEASFLVGGEFPIPIAQLGGGGTTQISIEYKEFGVQLRFTPTVLGNGKIELKLRPEISQLSDVGGVEVLGTRVPSVLSRRVETTLELQTGQTFAIAGLINQVDSSRMAKVPGVGDIPVLGTLFRSVRYSREDTEMVVLVTASLVEPSSTDLNPATPGAFHEIPNDWELYVEGRIEGRTNVRLAPVQKDRLKRLGLDQLQGPGAWASYEGTPNNLSAQTVPTQK